MVENPKYIEIEEAIFIKKETLNIGYFLDLNELDATNMANIKLYIDKFHGHSSDNADKFLQDFSNFTTMNELNNDERKIAAFYLHLVGPARTWFGTLEANQKDTWAHLETAFNRKYINLDQQNDAGLLTESIIFNNIKLSGAQALEDFHSLVLEKGTRLNKNGMDILSKFIEGLPQQLAFFVRASRPADHQAALVSAKMGEAYGYRQESTTTTSSNSRDTDVGLKELKDSVRELTQQVSAIQVSMKPKQTEMTGVPQYFTPPCSSPQYYYHNPQPQYEQYVPQVSAVRFSAPQQGPRTCYGCNGSGHIKRNCNWTGGSTRRPDLKCQTCGQQGHSKYKCRLAQTQSSTDPIAQQQQQQHRPQQGN